MLGPRPPRPLCGPRTARTPSRTGPATRPGRLAAQPGAQATVDRPGYRRAALVLILAASFMVVLDFSIVNVALASIQRELGFAASAAQWVVTGYAITFGGLLILGGRAADLFGRRRMFVTGLIVFSAASLAGGLAQDPVLLVASRAVQGVGAALVAPAALSLITTGFPEGPPAHPGARPVRRDRVRRVRGRARCWAASWSSSPAGARCSWSTCRSGWPRCCSPRRLLGRGREQRQPAAARRGRRAAHHAGGRLAWCSPCPRAPRPAGPRRWCWAPLGSRWPRWPAFAVTEGHQPDPLVRGDLLRLGSLRKGGALIMLLGVWNGGEMLVLSLYFQQVLHDSPLMTGLAIAPQGVVGFTAGLVGARLAARLGVRAAAGADQRRGHGRVPGAHPPARDRRVQPAAGRGDVRRLRHGGHRVRRHGHRQPRAWPTATRASSAG